jgi:hypothetical protein
MRVARFGLRRQNEVATALWPQQNVPFNPVRSELAKAVSRCALPPQSTLSRLRPQRFMNLFGLRRQSEAATALWPQQNVLFNPVRSELAKAVSRCALPPQSTLSRLRPQRFMNLFGLRRQSEAATALWPRQHRRH